MLRVEGVTKVYDPPGPLLRLLVRTAATEPVTALHGIDFEVASGEVVGLVGPNGAGKSTLLRICSTLLTPTTGAVHVAGVDLAREPRRARASVGISLSDDRALYWRLTGAENLRFFGVMAGLPPHVAQRRAATLMTQLGLGHRDRRVFGYSSGMRVLLGLARAMMADPPLLILDEPTRSLDPVASADLLGRLRRLADHGRGVLLSSHRLDEVEALCDRVLVVLDGQQVHCGPTARLQAGGSAAEALRAMLDGRGAS